jgi:hypothetical protein
VPFGVALVFCEPETEPLCELLGVVVVVVWVVVVDVCEFPLVSELPVEGIVPVWPVLPVEFVLLGEVLWAATQVAHSRRTDNNVVRAFIDRTSADSESFIKVTLQCRISTGPGVSVGGLRMPQVFA